MRFHLFRADLVRLSLIALGACLLFGSLCLGDRFASLGRAVFSEKPAEIDEAELCRTMLCSYGWEIIGEPTVREVTVPSVFDEVYTRYNTDIQLKNGYDLRKVAGKSVTLYEFTVQNYPSEDDVRASVLVYRGEIVGGDICSTRLDGFMHGFAPPDGVPFPSLSQIEKTARGAVFSVIRFATIPRGPCAPRYATG